MSQTEITVSLSRNELEVVWACIQSLRAQGYVPVSDSGLARSNAAGGLDVGWLYKLGVDVLIIGRKRAWAYEGAVRVVPEDALDIAIGPYGRGLPLSFDVKETTARDYSMGDVGRIPGGFMAMFEDTAHTAEGHPLDVERAREVGRVGRSPWIPGWVAMAWPSLSALREVVPTVSHGFQSLASRAVVRLLHSAELRTALDSASRLGGRRAIDDFLRAVAQD